MKNACIKRKLYRNLLTTIVNGECTDLNIFEMKTETFAECAKYLFSVNIKQHIHISRDNNFSKVPDIYNLTVIRGRNIECSL